MAWLDGILGKHLEQQVRGRSMGLGGQVEAGHGLGVCYDAPLGQAPP